MMGNVSSSLCVCTYYSVCVFSSTASDEENDDDDEMSTIFLLVSEKSAKGKKPRERGADGG